MLMCFHFVSGKLVGTCLQKISCITDKIYSLIAPMDFSNIILKVLVLK